MPHELPLTKTNRLRLSEAFRHNPRVDCSIDCVVEGQMGRAYVDDPENPTAWRITVGPFWYFAGDASGPGGLALRAELPPWNMLMPSPPGWAAAAKETFGERLVTFPRYSFDAGSLSEAHLGAILDASPHRAHGRHPSPDNALPLTRQRALATEGAARRQARRAGPRRGGV